MRQVVHQLRFSGFIFFVHGVLNFSQFLHEFLIFLHAFSQVIFPGVNHRLLVLESFPHFFFCGKGFFGNKFFLFFQVWGQARRLFFHGSHSFLENFIIRTLRIQDIGIGYIKIIEKVFYFFLMLGDIGFDKLDILKFLHGFSFSFRYLFSYLFLFGHLLLLESQYFLFFLQQFFLFLINGHLFFYLFYFQGVFKLFEFLVHEFKFLGFPFQ